MVEEMKKKVDTAFAEATEAIKTFDEKLSALRAIEITNPNDVEDEQEKQQLINIITDRDMRAAWLLKQLMVRHGNLVWL